jgi:hypothetical protein
MPQDELPQQILGRVMYVGKLLAAVEAQESIDKQARNKDGADAPRNAEGGDPESKTDSNPNVQKHSIDK